MSLLTYGRTPVYGYPVPPRPDLPYSFGHLKANEPTDPRYCYALFSDYKESYPYVRAFSYKVYTTTGTTQWSQDRETLSLVMRAPDTTFTGVSVPSYTGEQSRVGQIVDVSLINTLSDWHYGVTQPPTNGYQVIGNSSVVEGIYTTNGGLTQLSASFGNKTYTGAGNEYCGYLKNDEQNVPSSAYDALNPTLISMLHLVEQPMSSNSRAGVSAPMDLTD